MTERRQNDLALLLPSFRARVDVVLERMTARGFDPQVFETYRTPERAAALNQKGTGITASMHCFSAAVDVISKSRGWQWPEFYLALREEGERAGLISGYRFKSVDADHLQAIPVAAQSLFRALKPADRDAFVRVAMGPLKPDVATTKRA